MRLKIGKLTIENKEFMASSTFLKQDNHMIFIVKDNNTYYSEAIETPAFENIHPDDLDKYMTISEIYYMGMMLCMLIEEIVHVGERFTIKQLDGILERVFKHNDAMEEAVKNIRIE